MSINSSASAAPHVSIGIIAWNEERVIAGMLASVLEQSLFAELGKRKLTCEVLVVANGCTDRTAEIAREVCARENAAHAARPWLSCRTVLIVERGKFNAWNRFVHEFSAPSARFLVLMDADILICGRDTLWNLVRGLEASPAAAVAVSRPSKAGRPHSRSWSGGLAAGASELTRSAEAQLCGQLYCIRAEVARNIYLPQDLAACDDGFIKTLVCTDFLTQATDPARILSVKGAEHSFEAYTSVVSILKNQKRQVIGQTMVHILVDQYLGSLPLSSRRRLAETLRRKDSLDPFWLRRLIAQHLRRVRFSWRLYPGLLTHRFRRLGNLRGWKKIQCLPAAVAGTLATLIAAFAAFRFLKSGNTTYWPRARRTGLPALNPGSAVSLF